MDRKPDGTMRETEPTRCGKCGYEFQIGDRSFVYADSLLTVCAPCGEAEDG